MSAVEVAAAQRDAIVRALAARGYVATHCAHVPEGPSQGWHYGYRPAPGRSLEAGGGMACARDADEALRAIAALPYPKRAKGV